MSGIKGPTYIKLTRYPRRAGVDFPRPASRTSAMRSPSRPPVLRVLFAAIALPVALFAEKPFSFTDTPGQLPKTAQPRHYTLRIQPDLEARTTTGTARIELDVLQPVTELVMNALALEVDAAALIDDVSHPVALTPQLDAAKRTLTLPVTLAAGPHVITINYRGKIGTAAEGFFVDKYPTPSGDKLMLGTQFEPTDARRVFPCWDEPVYRATYDITLVVPEKLMAVANMPVEREIPLPGGLKEVVFARTPAMASYLVALYAGEFEAVEGEQDGVKLRILTTEGKRASAIYALESTKRLLAYYNRYFGVKYPLPKLDQIAVPNAFATFGAMENWGCITYIDTALLYNPVTSSQEGRERVFQVIAHEMAHQWFGDLVTMAWWDNLWLNEGFASWMGTKSSNALNPDWQLWLRANTQKENAMALDARKTTHPIQRPILNESQANDAFDVISYQKGQSFLRMLEGYLGEDTFRAGIRLYAERHQFSNSTTADLWAALGDASGKPVVALAAGWTEQPGFPVVLVSTVGASLDDARAPTSGAPTSNRMLKLEQLRFTLNDPNATPLTWKVPVTLANTANLAATSVTLLENRSTTVPWPAGAGTVKANVGDTGFYRVLYDDLLGDALRAQIATLPVSEQLNFLGDTWALVEAGRVPAASWLDLAEKLTRTRSQPVLAHLLNRLLAIDRLELNQPGRSGYQAWIVKQFAPQLARLGWASIPGESPLDSTLRAQLIVVLGQCGDVAVIAECTRRFEAYLRDPASLPGSLRGPVLLVVGRYASPETYAKLHALARAALTTEEKRRAYAAMQVAQDPALVQETLALSLGHEMSTSESTRNLSLIATEGEHPELVWDFARQHLPELMKEVTFFGRNVYLPRIVTGFDDAARADELEDVVRKNLPPDALPEAARTADLVRHLAAVKKRELPGIDAWVKTRVQSKE
ncbi:MAG: pepN [Lacunisphaera sp.]|nr:pepN [Lacunisphaera sp.]